MSRHAAELSPLDRSYEHLPVDQAVLKVIDDSRALTAAGEPIAAALYRQSAERYLNQEGITSGALVAWEAAVLTMRDDVEYPQERIYG